MQSVGMALGGDALDVIVGMEMLLQGCAIDPSDREMLVRAKLPVSHHSK